MNHRTGGARPRALRSLLLLMILILAPALVRADADESGTSSTIEGEISGLVETDEAPQQPLVLDEVVVTAQRREQRLIDVPVSVTSFSGDALERQNITDAGDLLSPDAERQLHGRWRGRQPRALDRHPWRQRPEDGRELGDQLDRRLSSMSSASRRSPRAPINPQLQDLERVEVLRGPQGDLLRSQRGRRRSEHDSTRKPTGLLGRGVAISLGGDLYGIDRWRCRTSAPSSTRSAARRPT